MEVDVTRGGIGFEEFDQGDERDHVHHGWLETMRVRKVKALLVGDGGSEEGVGVEEDEGFPIPRRTKKPRRKARRVKGEALASTRVRKSAVLPVTRVLWLGWA